MYKLTKKLEFNSIQGKYAMEIAKTIANEGYTAFLAGGCVRDLLLGRQPVDYDIVTDASSETISNLFSHASIVGKSFEIIKLKYKNYEFDIARFRQDIGYSDGRHPDTIIPSSPELDAKRRDFTINALFYDVINSCIIDYVDGIKDINNKIIRTVDIPDKSFSQDYLRMLRAIRFSSVLGFSLEKSTLKGIINNAEKIKKISAERIRDELIRILVESPAPSTGFILMHDTDLLKILLPEVEAMIHIDQPPQFHPEGNVFEHTMRILDEVAKSCNKTMKNEDLIIIMLSALFHDVGKVVTKTITDNGRIRFNGHAVVGSQITGEIMERLRFPKKIINDVTSIIKRHMQFIQVKEMRESTLRRFVSTPYFHIELELHRADCVSSHSNLENYEFLKNYLNNLANKPLMPPRWITGYDLLDMGIPEGPEMGKLLKYIYDLQLEGKFNSRDEFLEWIKKNLLHKH